MTIAQFDLRRLWNKPYTRGASLFVDESEPSQIIDFPGEEFTGLTGTSGSALLIERTLPSMFEIIGHWESILERISGINKDDFVVLMPPKRQYKIDLEINYLGRAKPFINIEQLGEEVDGD